MAAKRILVVEDNPSSLQLVMFILAKFDYETRAVTSAQEVYTMVESFAPDLLLLDMQLPDEDGLSVVKRLKADPKTRGIPIVAVTAFAMTGDEQKARAVGVCDYITKPIDRKAFCAAVAHHLHGGSAS